MTSEERQIIEQIPHLRRYARALLRDRDAADDLVQECLARAMDRLHTWRPDGAMRSWLFTILHNLYVNQRRKESRSPDLRADSDGLDAESAPADHDAGLAVRDIAAALGRLPQEQRSTILLVGLEGLSYEEAATVTGVPVGTVMSRLARGREKLRELMETERPVPLRRVR
jgi:RNA polymerase sigma-70 factor (ECF subfamily)